MASLTPQQQQTARMLYQLGRSKGLNHQRSLEFVSAAYSESGLDPSNYYGKSRGAAFVPGRTAGGLYELLSSGYVGKAQQLGGILKARPNALAILPSYLKYWHDHPGAAPGQGGAAVEASGEGAGFYSKGLGLISSLIGQGGPAASTSIPQTSAPVAQAPPVVDTGPLRQQALQALISTIGQKTPDRSGFLGGLQAVKQAETQNAAAPVAAAPPPTPRTVTPGSAPPTGDLTKWVRISKNADRAGASTSPAVLRFVASIAQQYGSPLTIGTGTNHNQYVINTHRESAHWTGRAADIPASGAALTRLGQAALIAAGMPRAQAMKATGGLFNIGRYQIIFNSMTGGNHYTHLHVGVR